MSMEINGFSKEYLAMRLGEMLAANDNEHESFRLISQSLSEEQLELFEAYQNALIERQIHELYYAYMYGLHDGINVRKLVTDE